MLQPARLLLCVCCVGLVSQMALAQRAEVPKPPPRTPWANKVFLSDILDNETLARAPAPAFIEHDFGTVPAGTLCSHTFQFTNIYNVPLQVIDIRTESACLKATPPNKILEPYEQAEFTVTMNAAAFQGAVTKKLFVTVGPNYYSTAELHFKAHSRTDVALTPGLVDFGLIPQGDKATKAVTLRYTGAMKDWKITGAPSVSGKHLDVEVSEAARGFVSTDYTIAVSLKGSTNSGLLNDTITLKTNDPATPNITLAVGGTVLPPVSVTPALIEFSGVLQGQPAQASVILKAKANCTIQAIHDGGDGITVETFNMKRELHIVTVKYDAAQPKPIRKEIVLRTNLPGNPETTLTIVVK